MKFKKSYTPRHWEFGVGFYLADWYVDLPMDSLMKLPREISILFGPFSFTLSFGYKIQIEAEPR